MMDHSAVMFVQMGGLEFMRIEGEWQRSTNGVTRPIMKASVVARDGTPKTDDFLVDSGADRTVFSADFLKKLRLSPVAPSVVFGLEGIGGKSEFVVLATALGFKADDGRTVLIRGEFAAFTDFSATDVSILGRDVTDQFDVILSRKRDALFFLLGHHSYKIVQA